jgi:iron complex outermembrane recepter protein
MKSLIADTVSGLAHRYSVQHGSSSSSIPALCFSGCLLASSPLFLIQSVAAADDAVAASIALETVTVTAQKREESLQDVPISIAAISADQLEGARIDSVSDLSRAVPGFNEFHSFYGESRPTFSLRGVGTVSNGQMTQPSVGVVIDGVTIARSAGGMFNFDDVARLEVLRGPQGTLFGRNTSAGMISITTPDPTSEFGGSLGVTYGSFDEFGVHGAVSGPIVDGSLSGRLSFFANQRDGYIHNIQNGKDYNDSNERGVRAKLLFEPASGSRILLNVDYTRKLAVCCTQTVIAVDPTSNLVDRGLYPGFTYPDGFIRRHNDQVIGSIGPPINDRPTENRVSGVSVQWDQDIGDFTLTSISAYRTWYGTWDIPMDTDPVNLQLNGSIATGDLYQVSQELRIASPQGRLIEYVAGVFGYKDRLYQTEAFHADLSQYTGTPPGGSPIPGGDWTSHSGSDNYAVFGDANINVSESVTFIAGLRQTREKIFLDLSGVYLGGAPMDVDDSYTEDRPSWRAGARWRLSADHMLYTTVSEGFKGAAYNDKSSIVGDPQLTKPEVATSYELGWKSTLLDNRVRANVALFLMDIKDFQATSVLLDPDTGAFTEFSVNAGKLQTRGVELEVQAAPVPNLSLNLNAAYIDSEFKEFPRAPCYTGQPVGPGECSAPGGFQDIAGFPNALVPKLSYNFSASYDLPPTRGGFVPFVRVDYAWKDEVQWSILQDPLAIEGSYGLLGASLGVRGIDDRFALTLYGKNLTNEWHTGSLSRTAQFLPPDYQRTWGLSAQYKL